MDRKILPFSAFVLSRQQMPQIDSVEDFVQYNATQNVESELQTRNPSDFTPTQFEFDQEKVDQIISDGDFENHTIIVSKDGFVLDGHHRWMASYQAGVKIKAIKVGLNIVDLLRAAEQYLENHERHQS